MSCYSLYLGTLFSPFCSKIIPRLMQGYEIFFAKESSGHIDICAYVWGIVDKSIRVGIIFPFTILLDFHRFVPILPFCPKIKPHLMHGYEIFSCKKLSSHIGISVYVCMSMYTGGHYVPFHHLAPFSPICPIFTLLSQNETAFNSRV